MPSDGNTDLKALFSEFNQLLKDYHGSNYGSAQAFLGWLHLNLNRKSLQGTLDNIPSFNLYGERATGQYETLDI